MLSYAFTLFHSHRMSPCNLVFAFAGLSNVRRPRATIAVLLSVLLLFQMLQKA